MTLSPADRTRLRNVRGEFMEGVEVVTITRADLDALLDAIERVEAMATRWDRTAITAGGARQIRAALGGF